MFHSHNRYTYSLQCHIVFVCKYRRKVFNSHNVSEDIKSLSKRITEKHGIHIKYMETDIDHIHYCIEYTPTQSVSNIVRMLKSYTSYHIWLKYPDYLRLFYYNKHLFWSKGYFVSSIGNVSEKNLKHYIENQGKE